MKQMIKPILLTALGGGQIDHSLANAIAAAAGIDLDEVIDPIKTADDLLLIGRQLLQHGAIDSVTVNVYEFVANSILDQLDKFEIA